MNKSQTANGINRFQRNSNQSSLIDTYSPKRTQTIVNSLIPNRANTHEYRILNKNFKINRLGSFESVLSQTVTIQSIKRKKFSKKKLKLNQLIKPALNNTATICNF